MLQRLQNQLLEGSQRRCITSILSLLSARENQTLTIVEDIKELRVTNKLASERLSNIIQQTKQDKQRLAEQIKDNYVKSEKENKGFLGLFSSKKKSRLRAEIVNETILQKNKIVPTTYFTHKKKRSSSLKIKRVNVYCYTWTA